MFNRKKLDRERLEAYLVYLMLKVRLLVAFCGILLLLYSIAMLMWDFLLGSVLILIAAYLVSLSLSFELIVFTARWGAWLATLGQKE